MSQIRLYIDEDSIFYHLHTVLLSQGDTHAGIIFVQQQRYTIGDQLRAVLRILTMRTAEDMENDVVFVSSWID